MGKFFDYLKKSVKETAFPSNYTCDICGIETFGTNLCPDCKATVCFIKDDCCPVCGRKTVRPEICMECKSKPPLYKRGVSSFVYEDGGVRLIKKFKDGSAYLKDYFAELLSQKVADLSVDCMVYVPMTDSAVKRRGYNQCKLLANSLSKLTGLPVIEDALEKIKNTPQQKRLSRKERQENLKGCFCVTDKREIEGKRILIIDDVITTGATAEAVTERLLKAGAKEVYLATVASVEYKPDSDNISPRKRDRKNKRKKYDIF